MTLEERAEKIGLYYSLAHDCITEQQQDVMLDLQGQIGFEKLVYEEMAKKSPTKPTRDHEAALKKLDDLIEYARSTGDKDSWVLLQQVRLQRKESSRHEIKRHLKAKIEEKLLEIGTSKTRIEILTKSYMQLFDSYEVTKRDWDILHGFDIEEPLKMQNLDF